MKPIIFISSVSKEYETKREAARRTISAAGAQPLGFEDFPAVDKSPRNACLDGVRECDIYLGIFGQRYGTRALSGKSITEEEFDEAMILGKRRLIFIENVPVVEEEQRRFFEKVGNYTSGRLWKKFNDISELESQIINSLKEILPMSYSSLTFDKIQEILSGEIEKGIENERSQAWLATAALPVDICELARDAEFFDDRIPKDVFYAGMAVDPPVFEIESAKSKELERDYWELTQGDRRGHDGGERFSCVRVYQKGLIFVAMNITGRESKINHGLDMYVDPNIIKPVASAQLHFIAKVYDIFDKHSRWDRIALLSALYNVGYRTFGSPQPGQTSFPMRIPNSDKPIIAFDSFKQLDRLQLRGAEYIEDLIAVFKRRIRV